MKKYFFPVKKRQRNVKLQLNLLFLSSVSRSKLNDDCPQSGGPCKMSKRFKNVSRNSMNAVLSIGDSMIKCEGKFKANS